MKTLGQKIRFYRNQKRMSQDELAKIMNYCNRTAISKIERGENDVGFSDIPRWAKALGVSPVDLLPEEYIKNQASLDARIIRDFELKKMIEKYYSLETEKQKIVQDLIDTLSK